LIDDHAEDTRAICELFERQESSQLRLRDVASMEAAKEEISRDPVDVVLLDMGLPTVLGQDAVAQFRAIEPRAAIVLLADQGREAQAIKAVQDGAQDYLIRGQIDTRELMRSIRNAFERKRLEERLIAEKERAQVTLDCMGDGVICSDNSGTVTFLNGVAETLTGWGLQDAVGERLTRVFRIVNADTRAIIANPLEKAIEDNAAGHPRTNTILIRRDGLEAYIEDSAAPILDRSGATTGSVIVFRDVSKAQAFTEKIVYSSQHDSLTGLPNRLLLTDRLGQAIALAARHKTLLAVLFMDLDGFKHINDSLGHPTGDKVLQAIAQRLRLCVRTPDTVSRQGGDEFVALLQDARGPEDIIVAAKRAMAAVTAGQDIANRALSVTVSMGISVYPNDGADAETLIKNADTAMYHAKRLGQHNFAFFQPGMNLLSVERQFLEEAMRRALEVGEFTLNFQPKFNLTSGKITGAETLIRWNHPTRGMMPPSTFIPVAENCGLIGSIGAWVLRETCKQARVWLDDGLPIVPLAVNVSAAGFGREGFVEDVFFALSDCGLTSQSLELEVTERVLMHRTDSAAGILSALRRGGVEVHVDDFGTGYSSLSHLSQFPLDALKIDRSFVHKIHEDSSRAAIVSAIICMGKSLRLRVVAEGVETSEDLNFLKDHACDEAQGYFLSMPISAVEFAHMLRESGVH